MNYEGTPSLSRQALTFGLS